jgi:hypothetical protein
MKAAEDGVAAFHQAMNAGNYNAIYNGASPELKSSITRDDFAKLMVGLHSELGNFRSGKTFGWSESDTHINTPAHLTLNREATFQRAAAMREQFIFRIENGRAILAGYNFHPRPPLSNG